MLYLYELSVFFADEINRTDKNIKRVTTKEQASNKQKIHSSFGRKSATGISEPCLSSIG
jgi:hypothetical protein